MMNQVGYPDILKRSHLLPKPIQLLLTPQLMQFGVSHARVAPDPKSGWQFAMHIKLQTLCKCVTPVAEQLVWANPSQSGYLITAVVSFVEMGYHMINAQLATWICSGGTRIIPLKSSSSSEQIQETLLDCHVVVIPQFPAQPPSQFLRSLALSLRKHPEIFILAVGCSALAYLNCGQLLVNCGQLLKVPPNNGKTICNEVSVYCSHEDPFYTDLSLEVRLAIQNHARIVPTAVGVSIEQFYDCRREEVVVNGLYGWKEEWRVLSCRFQRLHCIFFEPHLFRWPQAIAFSHSLLNGFMDLARREEKKVRARVEVESYKLIRMEDDMLNHYNVDRKL